jgi:hypothetical protein
MMLFLLGVLTGWIVTGAVDYYVTQKIRARAYEQGQDDALKQVSGW